MKQANLLYKYQTLEDRYLKFKKEINTSENRKKLLKLKQYLIKQNKELKAMTDEVNQKNKIYRKINSVVEDLTYNLKNDHQLLYSGEINDIKQLEHLQNNAERYKREISKKEDELIKLIDEIKLLENKVNKIRINMAKAKKEYVKVNKLYDQEMNNINNKINQIKAQMNELQNQIEPQLLERYKKSRKYKNIVVAKLVDNKCTGCNMSLPSAVISSLKKKDEIIECENCGRIICTDDL